MLKTQTSFSKDYFKLMPCILITCFGFIISYNWGVLVFLKFAQFSSELTKTWSSGATKCKISIGKCNVKVWKSTEHQLHKIWCSLKFCVNSGIRAHPWNANTSLRAMKIQTTSSKYSFNEMHSIWVRFLLLVIWSAGTLLLGMKIGNFLTLHSGVSSGFCNIELIIPTIQYERAIVVVSLI